MTKEAGYHCCSGHLFIDITDFELAPPSRLLGLIVVDEKIQIDFYIKPGSSYNDTQLIIEWIPDTQLRNYT